MTKHTMDIRIYYEDTDAGGVVYHANYLNFAERGRTEFLRELGHQNSELERDFGVLFVVKHIDIEYAKPAFLDDQLRMESVITEMKNSSFIMQQTLYCESRDNELISDMRVALVTVDTNTIKPVRLPEIIRTEFSKFLEG
jgi:acyl-CoA thioester hydrolase